MWLSRVLADVDDESQRRASDGGAAECDARSTTDVECMTWEEEQEHEHEYTVGARNSGTAVGVDRHSHRCLSSHTHPSLCIRIAAVC